MSRKVVAVILVVVLFAAMGLALCLNALHGDGAYVFLAGMAFGGGVFIALDATLGA